MFGRRLELDRTWRLLATAAETSCRLEIIGDPGIGKTTLLDATLERARESGVVVLAARPTMAERALGGACLGDLLRDVGHLPSLDEHHARVLDIALARRPPEAVPPTPYDVGVALLAVLTSIGESGSTVLVAVDDAQWLDDTSSEVLAFALRRLPASHVAALICRRPGGEAWFERDEQLALGPLDLEAVRQVVRAASPAQMTSGAAARIAEAAGGNPLFAVELARTAASDDASGALVPLPVPGSLGDLVAARVAVLPTATVEALAMVALLAEPTIDRLERLGVLGDLAPAERAGVVVVRDRAVCFSHPLLASAAHDAAPGTRRLELHRRLAEVTTGRARSVHLALGTTSADVAVAAELIDGVTDLVARGAVAEAAELALLAVSITPLDGDRRWDWMIVAGEMLFRAGRTDDAVAMLEAARVGAPSPETTARACLALAAVEFAHTDNSERAAELARSALALTDDATVRIDANTMLARVLYDDFRAAADHAAEALRLMESLETPTDGALAAALTASATASFMAGRGLDRAMFERAIVLERGMPVPVADSAAGALAALLKYADEFDEARVMLLALAQEADEGSLPYVIGHLPQLELWSGNWERAEGYARQQLELAHRTHQDSQRHAAQLNLATIAAYRGDVELATPMAEQLFDEGVRTGASWTERSGASLLGLLAMTVGDAPAAVRYLTRYDEIGEAMNLHEPGYVRFHGDLVEALVAVGEVERAESLLARIEPRAVRLGRVSALGTVRRGRALVFASRGDAEQAVAAASAAVAAYAGTALVYDRARAELTLGVVLRRFRRRAQARAALTEAAATFQLLGATSLVDRVRLELDRVGGRDDRPLALTNTENRVATLAAQGRTTRQIADALFVSAKTVEANLTRIYRKLGVTNRAELATRLAGDPNS